MRGQLGGVEEGNLWSGCVVSEKNIFSKNKNVTVISLSKYLLLLNLVKSAKLFEICPLKIHKCKCKKNSFSIVKYM